MGLIGEFSSKFSAEFFLNFRYKIIIVEINDKNKNVKMKIFLIVNDFEVFFDSMLFSLLSMLFSMLLLLLLLSENVSNILFAVF